ncbi:hypothetical protein ILUMI_02746 [Ignelater luminosus]|uniref:Uncharacterized protein n=1 Tax=Ignelater luminosus TaxID=2038154 RepID=A0A8K0DC18_IGNLU|nr:hypothetical protein ILUMI_02746 [Ignelater luminosus]
MADLKNLEIIMSAAKNVDKPETAETEKKIAVQSANKHETEEQKGGETKDNKNKPVALKSVASKENKEIDKKLEPTKQKSEDNATKISKPEETKERRESLTQKLGKIFRRKSFDDELKDNDEKQKKHVVIPESTGVEAKPNKETKKTKGGESKKETDHDIEGLSKEEFLTKITASSDSKDKSQKSVTDSVIKSEEIKPSESQTNRRGSLTQRITDKLLGRKGSASKESPASENSKALKPVVHQERLKPGEESSNTRKSTLKRGEGSPVTFFPLVEIKEDDEIAPPKKATTYNPFGSFQRHVSLATPDETRTVYMALGTQRPSVSDRRPSGLGETVRRSSSIKPGKKKSISVAELTQQDVAVCFFPEEPDWDDDINDEILPGRQRGDSIFPDPKSAQDWTKRERWESRLVYLIALVTYSISFSNIYHFPALVYHYGGMPFLIPYTVFTIILGYPLHFLESSLGQYSQSGPVRVWDCAPIARGVGWSMFLLCLGVGYYYNMYAAYSVIYFSRCFNRVLPWQDCDEPANPLSNYSCVPRMCARIDQNHYTPAEHYFFDHVLQIRYSDNILSSGLGPMVWSEVLGFFLAWIFVYVAIIQGVRSIGKVVFFLVILPYFVLFMLLTAGFLLKGSSRGMYMLFDRNFDRLLDIQVWRSAAEQVFFELGICQGIPLAYGSYCRHLNPTHIDSAIVCLVNYFTSILCAVVIFNILGALSSEMGVPATDVINQGPGIVFITYPEALSRVPGSHFWCISFFLMLFSVAIGTQIAIMETVMTVVYDEFYNAKPFRWLINLLICCCLFMLGIILCTSNGYFVVHLLDRMTGNMPRLPIAVCMVGTIILIYGVTKYCEDMHFMLNYYPNMFIRLCFLIMPFLLVALTLPSWYLMRPLRVREQDYTMDAIMVGWFTIWFILIWIVLGAFYWIAYCYYIGRLKDVWRSLNSWGPRNYKARIARTEFTSEDVSNYTKSWTKRDQM